MLVPRRRLTILGTRALIAFLAIAVAGCTASPSDAPAPAPAPNGVLVAEFSETTGALEGIVVDPEQVPVIGATVTIVEADVATQTNEEGRFALGLLSPGRHALAINSSLHFPVIVHVEVKAGMREHVVVQLDPMQSSDAYHVVRIQEGIVGCAVSVRPATETRPCELGFTGANVSTLHNINFDWHLAGQTIHWVAGINEASWQSSQILATGLTLKWTQGGCIGPILGETSGSSPLRIALFAEEIQAYRETLIASDPCERTPTSCPDDTCWTASRLFSGADTLGPSYPVDIGFHVQQRFQVFMSEFYYEEPEPSFTALPDS